MTNNIVITKALKIPMLSFKIFNKTFSINVHPNDRYIYATIDKNGVLSLHQEYPVLDEKLELWISSNIRYISVVKFKGDWLDSLIKL